MRKNPGYQTISSARAEQIIRNDRRVAVLDVRTEAERQRGFIPGSISIPARQLEARAPMLLPDKNRPILVYCQTGAKSWMSAELLASLGYSQVYDMGGFLGWQMARRF